VEGKKRGPEIIRQERKSKMEKGKKKISKIKQYEGNEQQLTREQEALKAGSNRHTK